MAVVEAVAAAEGVDPMELDPVYDEVDPDVVDRLFAPGDERSTSSTFLRFSVDGWNVFVRGDGVIRVCDPDCLTEPAPAFGKAIGD